MSDLVAAPASSRSRSRRHFAVLLISLVSLALSVAAIVLVIVRTGVLSLRSHDLSTPESTLRSVIAMQRDGDWPALLDYMVRSHSSQLKEALDTLKVEKRLEYRGKVILLVSFDRHGVREYRYDVLEKDASSGLWRFCNRLSVDEEPLTEYNIDDPEISEAVDDFTKRGKSTGYIAPKKLSK